MAALSVLLKDSPLGRFWLPGQAEPPVPGAIVGRNGTLQLELMEPFPDRCHASPAKESNFYPVVCGWLSKGGPITLFNCSAARGESIPGNEWAYCSFDFAIQGQPLENTDVYLFNSARVQLNGLVEWTGFNGLKYGWQEDAAVSGGHIWTASYAMPEPCEYRTDTGLTVKLLATYQRSSVGRFGLQFVQDAAMEVVLSSAVPFGELAAKVHDIRQLFMLLSGLELRPTWNEVLHVSAEEALALFHNRKPSPPTELDHPHLHTLVPFEDISTELPELLSRWSGVQDEYGDAVATGLFAPYLPHANETKISYLVNCLVRYAEADAGGKASHDEVIRRAAGKAGKAEHVINEQVRRYLPGRNEERIERLVRTLRGTRDYYTHFNPDTKEIAARGAELANLVDLLDVINRCALLEKLGLDRDRVIQWVQKSREYGKRFRMQRFQEIGA